MSSLEERREKAAEKIAECSIEITELIEKHRNNPKHAANETACGLLHKKVKTLHDEFEEYGNDFSSLVQEMICEQKQMSVKISQCKKQMNDDEAEVERLERDLQSYKDDIEQAESRIEQLESSIRRGNASNRERSDNLEITKGISIGSYVGGVATLLGGFVAPPLWIGTAALLTTSVGTLVAHKGIEDTPPVDVSDLRRRVQNNRNAIDNDRGRIHTLNRRLDATRSRLKEHEERSEELEQKIEHYRLAVLLFSVFQKILNHWMLFLADVEQAMDRIEGRFVGSRAVTDTPAYQDYQILINGYNANRAIEGGEAIKQLASNGSGNRNLGSICGSGNHYLSMFEEELRDIADDSDDDSEGSES